MKYSACDQKLTESKFSLCSHKHRQRYMRMYGGCLVSGNDAYVWWIMHMYGGCLVMHMYGG